QDPGTLAFPTPLERQLDTLRLHLGPAPLRGLGPNERPPARVVLLTSIALFAVAGRAILYYLAPLTRRTSECFHRHRATSCRGEPLLASVPLRSTRTDSSSRINK